MVKVLENEFTRYEFDERELPQAAGFSDLNVKWIRNTRATWAITKSNLGFSGTNDTGAILQSEYLRGGMAALDMLLQEHERYETARTEDLRSDMISQGNIYPAATGVDISSIFTPATEESKE